MVKVNEIGYIINFPKTDKKLSDCNGNIGIKKVNGDFIKALDVIFNSSGATLTYYVLQDNDPEDIK